MSVSFVDMSERAKKQIKQLWSCSISCLSVHSYRYQRVIMVQLQLECKMQFVAKSVFTGRTRLHCTLLQRKKRCGHKGWGEGREQEPANQCHCWALWLLGETRSMYNGCTQQCKNGTEGNAYQGLSSYACTAAYFCQHWARETNIYALWNESVFLKTSRQIFFALHTFKCLAFFVSWLQSASVCQPPPLKRIGGIIPLPLDKCPWHHCQVHKLQVEDGRRVGTEHASFKPIPSGVPDSWEAFQSSQMTLFQTVI